MNYKKIIGISVVLSLTLAACGNPSQNTSDTEKSETETRTEQQTVENSQEGTVFQGDVATQQTSEESTAQEEVVTEIQEQVQNQEPGWKQALLDEVKNDEEAGRWAGYNLIYLDGDDIPELVKIGGSEADGVMIANYGNGTVYRMYLNRLNFSYIPNENLLCNSDGNMDVYYDVVYSVLDGKLTEIADGNYGAADNANLEINEDGTIIYTYSWNGEEMDQDAYTAAFHAVYDETKAVPGYDWENMDSLEEICTKIEGL